MVDSIARHIVNRKLEVPSVLFLEMHKPLSFVASQATIVAMPFLAPIVGARRLTDLSRLLAEREHIEILINRIEELAAERDSEISAKHQGEHTEQA
ncbi:MAG: hypothetical protein ACUVRS_07135 [Armatimonadota bacterium]